MYSRIEWPRPQAPLDPHPLRRVPGASVASPSIAVPERGASCSVAASAVFRAAPSPLFDGADIAVSYQVLARKWRPRNFEQLVGQAHVARALVNALDADRLHHAFLFSGTRGSARRRSRASSPSASTARPASPRSRAASAAPASRSTRAGFVDLLEVDAASRSKVDETRDLMDNVQFSRPAAATRCTSSTRCTCFRRRASTRC